MKTSAVFHFGVAAILLLWLPCLGATRNLPETGDTGAISSFRSILFCSTKFTDGFGKKAVDLYWNSQELKAFHGSRVDFNRALEKLYDGLAGDHIIRAKLTDAGWNIETPRATFIVGKSLRSTEALFIVSNHTSTTQKLAAVLAGKAGLLWQSSLVLPAGETRAVRIQPDAPRLGIHRATLSLHGTRTTSTQLTLDVRPVVTLQVRILDAGGRVTAARVYVHGADGRSAMPTGAFDRAMWMTAEHYFYSGGKFTVILPAGVERLEIRKGFDYLPVTKSLDLSSKNHADVKVHLKWLRNMNAKGWYSADDHIHGNYTGVQWTTPKADALVVHAEGLNVGDMKVSNGSGSLIHDERYFQGHPNAVSTPTSILYWNEEMRTATYGHLVLINLKHLVKPIYTGFPGTPHWEDYPSNYSQAEQARRQGGIAIYAHPALTFDQFPTGSLAAESVVDVPLGAIDDFEVFCSHDEPSMALWYHFLNLGFRLGITAGSDAFLNQRFSFLAGGERMYVYTGKKFSYARWIDGIRRERTFATVGPLLSFRINGKMAGSKQHFVEGPVEMPVKVSAVSSIPMSRIEVVANGAVVASAQSRSPVKELALHGNISIEKSSWIAVRVWGPDNDRISNGPSRWAERRSPLVLLAHSSPAYVYIGKEQIYSQPDLDFCLRWLDSLTRYVREHGKFANNAHRESVLDTFARARRVYEQLSAAAGVPRQ